MKIEATQCVTKEMLQDDSYYIRTFDRKNISEIHRNCTFIEMFSKLVCFKRIREESYSIPRTDVVKVVGNHTEALIGTGAKTIDTDTCLYHNIQNFTVEETESDFEMLLSWRVHAWDRYEYINRIIITRNERSVQTLNKHDTQFIIKDLNQCTKYNLCVKTETLTADKTIETLNKKCQMVTTKCLELEPEPILSFVEIIVTIMFFIMACMIVTLIVYHVAQKRRRQNHQEQDQISEETIADDKYLEQAILRTHFPIHKADHTYVDTRLLTG
jgi:hypothetical protein